jgi:putative radical SAM enzyme (TIGR03279 family)
MVKISKINLKSPAHKAGLRSGDFLLLANGKELHDALDVEFYVEGNANVEVTYRRHDEMLHAIIENPRFDFSGIEAELLKLRRCRNRCIFCFIDQQPKGLRQTLYVKDEDIRYSFLYGNYITATNTPKWEWDRIIEQRMGPLYFSVHSTNEETRSGMLGVKDAPPIFPILSRLTKTGIQIHSQIVLVPGFNDGEVLKKTLRDLYSLGENSFSCAVVPVGLTKYRDGLPHISPVSESDACKAIEIIDEFRNKSDRPEFFQAADELFYLAGFPIPEGDYYGDFPQLDNGVGMMHLFIDDITSCNKQPKVKLEKNRKLSVEIITGIRAANVFEDILPQDLGIEGVTAKITAVQNDFWGGMVSAANLLTGGDILRTLDKSTSDIVFVPPKVINDDGLFLDGLSIEEVDNAVRGEIAVGADYLSDMQELIIDYSSRS